jgi:hypothetical protein
MTAHLLPGQQLDVDDQPGPPDGKARLAVQPRLTHLTAEFPPLYYDCPVTLLVLDVPVAGLVEWPSATITAGAQYFTVTEVTASPLPPVRLGGTPPGGQRLPAVQPGGQPVNATVQVLVTAEVPAGAGAPIGPLTGTLQLSGNTLNNEVTPLYEVELHATLLGTIIGEVSVQPATVVPGQPVQITVLDSLGALISDPAVTVTVQGIPGSSRWEQYATAGTSSLLVTASNGTRTETRRASIAVTGPPLEFTAGPAAVTQLPIIAASIVPGLPYAGSITLGTPRSVYGTPVTAPISVPPAVAGGNAAANPAGPADGPAAAAVTATRGTAAADGMPPRVPPAETEFTWDFGDGSPPVTTQSPAVTHDFFPAVTGSAAAYSFDVTCTAVHDGVSVKRTIVLHSAYGLCRQTGVIVPPVTGAPAYAPPASVSIALLPGAAPVTVPLGGFSASMIVHNLEPLPIVLQSMAIVPMSDDPAVPPPPPEFTAMATPQEIAPGSASALGAFVPFSALSLGGPPANAFAVYYAGTMPYGPPPGLAAAVCFSVIFRISATYSGVTVSASADSHVP